MWNTRRTESTAFLRDYENLICDFASDYRQVDHRNIDEAKIHSFFASVAVSIPPARQPANIGLRRADRPVGVEFVPALGRPSAISRHDRRRPAAV